MSDAKENTPNKPNTPEGQNKDSNERRRSRGGRNRNRNRGKKEGEGQAASSDPAKSGEVKASESGAKEEGAGGNRNNRGRNRNNRNKRREGKDVKASPVSEDVQSEYDLQKDLYDINFSASSNTAVYEETVLEKPVIGITCGDLNGIGMEVIISMLGWIYNEVAVIVVPVISIEASTINENSRATSSRISGTIGRNGHNALSMQPKTQ